MIELEAVEYKLSQLRIKLAALDLIRHRIKGLLSDIDDTIALHESKIDLYEKTSLFAQQVKALMEVKTIEHLEEVVTIGLRYIYNCNYVFKVKTKSYKSKSFCEFEISTPFGDKTVTGDPRWGRGGGIREIIALILRILFVETYEPRNLMPLIFDEKLRMVYKDNIKAVGKFIRAYTASKNRQLIFVTHDSTLAEIADVCYAVSKNADGSANIERMTNV